MYCSCMSDQPQQLSTEHQILNKAKQGRMQAQTVNIERSGVGEKISAHYVTSESAMHWLSLC